MRLLIHDWGNEEIIKAYHGQSTIEQAFRNIKNPAHLTLKPQFHWTDQKIIVHYFICVLAYLLASLVWRQAKLNSHYEGSLDSLFDLLNNVKLGAVLEDAVGQGRVKATYKLEAITKKEQKILDGLGVSDLHNSRPKFQGVGVYK
jgi:hypothetical protein